MINTCSRSAKWFLGLFLLVILMTPGHLAVAQQRTPEQLNEDLTAMMNRIQQLEQRIQSMQEEHKEEISHLKQKLDEFQMRAEFEAELAQEFEYEAPVAPSLPLPGTGILSARQPGVQRMNPDIGVVLDTVARFSDEKDLTRKGLGEDLFEVDDANRWMVRDLELIFTGYIDPYAKLDAYVVGDDEGLEIEEAYVTLFEMPFNTKLRVGRFLLPYGIFNQVHDHDLPTVDRPPALLELFGDHISDDGIELSWLVPNPWDLYSEILLSITKGDDLGVEHTLEHSLMNSLSLRRGFRFMQDDDPDSQGSSRRDWVKDNLIVARWVNFFELSNAASLQLGLNLMRGVNHENEKTAITAGGFDVKYKYVWPDHRMLLLQLEQIWLEEEARFLDAGDEVLFDKDISTHGGYLLAEYQFIPKRWSLGGRFDWFGHRRDFDPYYTSASGDLSYGGAVFLTYSPSEFQRWRLQYRCLDLDYGYEKAMAHEVMLQGTFTLGFHPPHRF